jgi:hypothetical protein
MMRPFACLAVASVVVVVGGGSAARAGTPLRQVVAQHLRARGLSQGVQEWLNPPKFTPGAASDVTSKSLSFGSNVDAAEPQEDVASGQSETAIDASASGRVMVAWNDISALAFPQGNGLRSSFTGVGYSADGGQSFTDLVGLRNPNPDQQWNGDPAVVSIDGGAHFVVGSLFFPSLAACSDGKPAQLTVAVEVLTPTATGVVMGKPVVTSRAGDACGLFGNNPPPNIALLDKDFLAWDPTSRTLAMSFTRFFLTGNHTGAGEIDLARAHVPADATQLKSSDFHTTLVWPEEQAAENEGAYPALARGGDAYMAWERNWISNLFGSGDPRVYEHIAFVPADANAPLVGGKNHPIVVTKGQVNATPVGGVKSLDSTLIAGYSRGIGNDFPRIAWNPTNGRVIVAWNDGSLHPLGDIWLRSYSSTLGDPGAIARVNDDSDFTLHFMPAVSVRSNGRICTSWYDRRLFGPDSAHTDYFGECRPSVLTSRTDVRITTGATDWANTSSLIDPNFGDYTDNTSVGTTTYYTWSDGRIGIPQPFVDHH